MFRNPLWILLGDNRTEFALQKNPGCIEYRAVIIHQQYRDLTVHVLTIKCAFSHTCLRLPFSLVLSEKLARKYFGNVNPLGKVLVLNNVQPLTVTAVIEDLPGNVHVRYDALIQIYDPKGDSKNASFYDINVYTYLLFPDNYDASEFYRKFPAFHEKYAAEKGKVLNQEYKAVIQPLLKTHFSKEWTYDLPNGNTAYVIAFLVIGVLVLSLSCINYLNLTTARAEQRRKEISMKKILGSGRMELISQFLCESMLMAVIASIIALGLSQFILGFTSFNELIDKNLEIAPVRNMPFMMGVILLTVISHSHSRSFFFPLSRNLQFITSSP